MIGFFDSGYGGLTILKEAVRRMPEYSYLYLGDNRRAPYGNRSQEEIFEFTRQGVEFLFAQGVKLVILACNTSSSSALRRLQQEILPGRYSDRRVLGIIVPTAEEARHYASGGDLGILATPATVESSAYLRQIRKLWPELKVFQQACPRLVPLIENGESRAGELDEAIRNYAADLLARSGKIQAVILGCTHYALIEDRIRRVIPSEIKMISQGPIVAQKLEEYLRRHPELEERLNRKGDRQFFTTGDPQAVGKLAATFYGEEIGFQLAQLV